ncbi:MAG: hypothetical protein IPO40_18690 [Fibrobacteres bacterium]|nr:hypothetical protein [Fibrobacterota bacterium]
MDVIERIRSNVLPGTVIPKPKAKSDFIFLGWTSSGSESAISYSIPNRKDPAKPYRKYVRESEIILAYEEFVKAGEFTRGWLNTHLPKLAKEGSCSFTTIGGLLCLLGEARYEYARYCKISRNSGIVVTKRGIRDVFSGLRSKSARETLRKPRYQGLEKAVVPGNESRLDLPIGEFIALLKREGDARYKLFLNPNGDLEYCVFKLSDQEMGRKKGVYKFLLDGEMVYVGRCLDNFKKRFNSGYGKIASKNCFLDGQSTNCRLNALVNQFGDRMEIDFVVMENNEASISLEKEMLSDPRLIWNVQK